MERIALVPSYEPGDVLTELARELAENNMRVVVVDDGSGQDYQGVFDRVREYGTVIGYEVNQGKGHALKEGLRYVLDNCEECVVVTMDSDGQHKVEDALHLCELAEQDHRTFYLGSRVLPKDAPTRSRYGNAITRLVYKTATGLDVYDTQSGLRAFYCAQIPFLLEIPGERYEYEMNVLLQIAKTKRPIKEERIETIYFDKDNSVSHFNAWKDSVRIYKEIFKFVGSSLAAFVVDYVMYVLLLAVLGTGDVALIQSSFGARAVSSVFNFLVNKLVVFRSSGDLWWESAVYFGLVVFIICINTLLLSLLSSMGVNVYLAKILVEMVMFVVSYLMQHYIVFRKEKA